MGVGVDNLDIKIFGATNCETTLGGGGVVSRGNAPSPYNFFGIN